MTAAKVNSPQSMPMQGSYAPTVVTPQAPGRRTFVQGVLDQPWTIAGITLLIGYCLFPFLWLVRLSMDPAANGKILPSRISFEHYGVVFRNDEFIRAFFNSIIVAGSATAIAMAIG